MSNQEIISNYFKGKNVTKIIFTGAKINTLLK